MAPDTIFFEDDGYEISIYVNQIHGPRELEFIVHQIKPLISISFVEMWAGSLSFNIVDFYLFIRIWISDMQITQRKT